MAGSESVPGVAGEATPLLMENWLVSTLVRDAVLMVAAPLMLMVEPLKVVMEPQLTAPPSRTSTRKFPLVMPAGPRAVRLRVEPAPKDWKSTPRVPVLLRVVRALRLMMPPLFAEKNRVACPA